LADWINDFAAAESCASKLNMFYPCSWLAGLYSCEENWCKADFISCNLIECL